MLAIRAAQVFDGTLFRGAATVLVEGEHIVAVEPGHPEPPDGAEVATYDGTLLPGLFDSHVHLVADGTLGSLERAGELSDEDLDAVIRTSLTAQLAGGVTTVRDLGDRHYRTLGMRALPGLPRVVAAGPPITVPGGHCHYLGGEADGKDGVRAAVAEHVDRGVDVVKVMASGGMLTPGTSSFGTQFEPGVLRALVEAAHDAELRVLAHAHSVAGIRHAVAAGVDGIEHFTGLAPGGLQLPDDLLDEVAEAGTEVCPTAGADPAFTPTRDQVSPGLRQALEELGVDFPGFMAARIALFTRLFEHGVTVVTGTDAGISMAKRHGGARFAVHDLVRAGWSVAGALATATSGAAASCGLASVTGSLRRGYAADLLVVDGDLRDDVTGLGRPQLVMARGVVAGVE